MKLIYLFREFTKQMNADLPFCYWTLNERYSEAAYPLFDARAVVDDDEDTCTHPLHLHRLKINQRKDSSIIVGGKGLLPARHALSLRHAYHGPGNYLPPVPSLMDVLP